ncbi:Protein kinase C conserved region 1 (C1) domains (Cysteine-rich domains) [Rhizoctonia solani]|uniref:Protein kinase C conserved region 1 (C1) domains (Cysteine-rich domains) n=1 Tax=Rhizoctonia solani TaxID=456999 RepID=A0A8H7IHQ7_9AGAM|nr:Protein kinase C conserved region 1 (C1) domains (Cysteine-rich domains) [Rhizoctonia solani]
MQEAEPACGGCGRTLESASGGVVVAFGNALWHVECFRCAKCQNMSADTNLLLLADGSPVCQACSYSCHVCHNPILDEAIMTGDDSYHASCFKCRTCSRRIEELVFAKTSQGIYCMACHNDRVARSRRHADKKRSRTKSRKEDSVGPQSRATDFAPSPAPHSLAAPHDLGKRRKSYDDGVRPLSAMFAPLLPVPLQHNRPHFPAPRCPPLAA